MKLILFSYAYVLMHPTTHGEFHSIASVFGNIMVHNYQNLKWHHYFDNILLDLELLPNALTDGFPCIIGAKTQFANFGPRQRTSCKWFSTTSFAHRLIISQGEVERKQEKTFSLLYMYEMAQPFCIGLFWELSDIHGAILSHQDIVLSVEVFSL